jgi:hypothetical protein
LSDSSAAQPASASTKPVNATLEIEFTEILGGLWTLR